MKYEALEQAKTEKKTNPATGKLCQFYRCADCGEEFPMRLVQVDHIQPVRTGGMESWDSLIERLLCEIEGLQVLCYQCHSDKTIMENAGVERSEVPKILLVAAFKRADTAAQRAALREMGLDDSGTKPERVALFIQNVTPCTRLSAVSPSSPRKSKSKATRSKSPKRKRSGRSSSAKSSREGV